MTDIVIDKGDKGFIKRRRLLFLAFCETAGWQEAGRAIMDVDTFDIEEAA